VTEEIHKKIVVATPSKPAS